MDKMKQIKLLEEALDAVLELEEVYSDRYRATINKLRDDLSEIDR